MAEATQDVNGFYDHLLQSFSRLQSTLRFSNLHELLIAFHQKLLVGDAKSYYILLTSTFVLMFALIFTYYRLLELSKSSCSILRRKLERQEISKDRIKNYLLNVLEESFI